MTKMGTAIAVGISQHQQNFYLLQSKPTREERNERLLETLQLRGGDAYRKFRHVLYLTGHSFLADHLYGEGNILV